METHIAQVPTAFDCGDKKSADTQGHNGHAIHEVNKELQSNSMAGGAKHIGENNKMPEFSDIYKNCIADKCGISEGFHRQDPEKGAARNFGDAAKEFGHNPLKGAADAAKVVGRTIGKLVKPHGG
jgi:hypothetical protein